MFNYDIDSEDEWEDCEGEDLLSGEEEEDDGEGNANALDYEDGWLCQDDYVEYDAKTAALVAPVQNEDGDFVLDDDDDDANVAEEQPAAPSAKAPAASEDELKKREPVILEAFAGLNLEDPRHAVLHRAAPVFYVNFPVVIPKAAPASVTKAPKAPKRSREDGGAPKSPTRTNKKRVVADAELPALVEMLHHSNNSMEKMVELFKATYPSSTASKAQIKDKIKSIAVKTSVPTFSTKVWVVNADVLKAVNWTPPKQPQGVPPPPPKATKAQRTLLPRMPVFAVPTKQPPSASP